MKVRLIAFSLTCVAEVLFAIPMLRAQDEILCGNGQNPLVGHPWIHIFQGFVGYPDPVPWVSAGQFTASVQTVNGVQVPVLSITQSTSDGARLETSPGSYSYFADCSGGTLKFATSSRPLTFDFWFDENFGEIRLVSTNQGYAIAGTAKPAPPPGCPAGVPPLSLLPGDPLIWETHGGFVPAVQAPLPFASAGRFTASLSIVNGVQVPTLAITQSTSDNATLEMSPGSYQIFPDCSGGTLKFDTSSRPFQFDF